MSPVIVAVMNGAKARFLTLESSVFPDNESAVRLVEHEEILNTTNLTDEELWSSPKTGRNQSASGQCRSYDDHRQTHRIRVGQQFARAIATRIVSLLQSHEAQQLLLIAEPQIVGIMREALAPMLPKTLRFRELAQDLCHLKPHELREYLIAQNQLFASEKIPR